MKKVSIYPTMTLTLDGNKYQMEPYRVAEVRDYITPLESIQNKLNNLQSKVDLIKEDELNIENIDKLTEYDELAVDLKATIMEQLYSIAQLGLKRATYPEAKDMIGSELEEIPDIGISESQAGKVVNVMMRLANKDMPKVADTKNEVKERVQRKSGKDSING